VKESERLALVFEQQGGTQMLVFDPAPINVGKIEWRSLTVFLYVPDTF
jgi:hypothetical protein